MVGTEMEWSNKYVNNDVCRERLRFDETLPRTDTINQGTMLSFKSNTKKKDSCVLTQSEPCGALVDTEKSKSRISCRRLRSDVWELFYPPRRRETMTDMIVRVRTNVHSRSSSSVGHPGNCGNSSNMQHRSS